MNYGISGAIVAHPRGVTLAQPLGSQFAIVNANGASGVRFQNQQGIQTDWLGNAVIPSLTPYQENAIRIDTASLPENVESSDTSIRVIPSRNAAVESRFDAHVGYRMLIALTRPGNQRVPFGAIVTSANADLSGIVDDTSTVYRRRRRAHTAHGEMGKSARPTVRRPYFTAGRGIHGEP